MQIIRRPREDVVVPRDILKAGLSVGALGLWVYIEASPEIRLSAENLSDHFRMEIDLVYWMIEELVAAGIWERNP